MNSNINEGTPCTLDLVIETECCSVCVKGYRMDNKRLGKTSEAGTKQALSACRFYEMVCIQWDQENEHEFRIFLPPGLLHKPKGR